MPAWASLVMVAALLAMGVGDGCATTSGSKGKGEVEGLAGLVLDPEGEPVPFAKVRAVPAAPLEDGKRRKPADQLPEGAAGLAVTAENGRWLIDHFTADDGTDLGMPRPWYFEVTVYKAGYHVWKDSLAYDGGSLPVDVTLYPDSIDLDDVGNLVDTSLGETNTGTGVLRQGE